LALRVNENRTVIGSVVLPRKGPGLIQVEVMRGEAKARTRKNTAAGQLGVAKQRLRLGVPPRTWRKWGGGERGRRVFFGRKPAILWRQKKGGKGGQRGGGQKKTTVLLFGALI